MDATVSERDIDGGHAWYRLAISVVLCAIGSVGIWSFVVVLPTVQAEFAVARATASLPYAATMIGFALGSALLGRLADRFGIVVPVLLGALGLGSGYWLAAQSAGIWQFALAQGLLIGFLGIAASFAPLIADVSHWFLRRRGIAVGIVASGATLGGALWPPLVQYLVDTAGWRDAYVIVGLACMAAALPLSLGLRRRSPVSRSAMPVSSTRRNGWPEMSPRKVQALLVVAGIACCVAMSMPQVHLVAYCSDLGYGAARGAEMLSLMLALSMVSRLAFGVVSDRLGGVPTLLIGSALQFVALFFFLPFDGLASLYVVVAVFGLGQGGIVPSYAIIVREYFRPGEAGSRVGLVLMATTVGMALGGWLSGVIFDLTGSYRMAFVNGIAWNVLNLTIALWLLLGQRREAEPVPG